PVRQFDVLVLGAGMGGLTTAALFANSGKSVAVLERHSEVGGYAHEVRVGPARFCHQVQYLMGCEDGAPMHRFLARLGLERDVVFFLKQKTGYDIVVSPGRR